MARIPLGLLIRHLDQTDGDPNNLETQFKILAESGVRDGHIYTPA